jgi:hypothetical protein
MNNAVSGILRCVALVRTDVSEERSVSIISMARIGELGSLAVTTNPRTLRCTDVSEEPSASIIRVTRIGELGTLAETSNQRLWLYFFAARRLLITANVPSSPILVTLMMEAVSSSETSVLIRATRCNNLEDGVLQPSTFLAIRHSRASLHLAPLNPKR